MCSPGLCGRLLSFLVEASSCVPAAEVGNDENDDSDSTSPSMTEDVFKILAQVFVEDLLSSTFGSACGGKA